jgi:hypothetical protein
MDLSADDVQAAQARAIAAGGSRVAGYEDRGFLVMADTEGNHFRILPAGNWEMDQKGRAHYV